MKTTKQILKDARALISSGWCKGYLALTADGSPVYPLHISARRFCVLGAISRASMWGDGRDRAKELFAEAAGIFPKEVATWNDDPERTHAQVLEAFNKAIAIAEGVTCAP